jgi:lipopolysaccharide export system permease protein
MLKKIDWYILRKFITTFVFCMLLFTAIAVAVDSSEKTDDFVRTGLTTGQIIRQYYFGFVPFIWGLLYPLFVFIAVIFFTSKMALRSEIIAILASGVTFNRWLRPYVVGGILFGAGLWLANRYAIPKANELRSHFEIVYMGKGNAGGSQSSFYLRIDTNTYVGVKYYDTTSKSAGNFFLDRISGGKLVYNLRAGRMQWDTAQKTWKLTNVVERRLGAMGEQVVFRDSMKLALNLHPEELRKDEFAKDRMTTPQLSRYIQVEELRGTEGLNALKVEQFRRSATPVSVLLLTIIGAVVAGRKTRGGSGLHLAIGIIIAAVFIVSDRFSTVFSVKGNLPPLLAAWLPNLFFSLVALYLYRKAPK